MSDRQNIFSIRKMALQFFIIQARPRRGSAFYVNLALSFSIKPGVSLGAENISSKNIFIFAELSSTFIPRGVPFPRSVTQFGLASFGDRHAGLIPLIAGGL